MPAVVPRDPKPGRGRRPGPASNGLSESDVVEAALRIVESEGVSALSMRRLADELGAAVTAIYWHVGNRDALVELMIGRLLAGDGRRTCNREGTAPTDQPHRHGAPAAPTGNASPDRPR